MEEINTAADRILHAGLEVGEQMLRCGAEINRVEDTIWRICRHYGAEWVDVFAIYSLIVAQVRLPDGSHSSQMRRVHHSSNNLDLLERLNALSRKICTQDIPCQEVKGLVAQEVAKKCAPLWLTYVGAILAAGGFAVFFQGTWLDGLAAALIGVIIQLIENHHPRSVKRMAQAVLSAFVAGALTLLLMHFHIGQNLDKIMIGTIMLLIPGLSFGTSLRDMLYGDIVAGSMRFLQSLLLAGAIALGYAGAILLGGLV